MAVHGFRGAIGRLACGLPVGLRLQSYQILPEKRRSRLAYLPKPGWLWRFLLMVLGRLPSCRPGAALTLPPRGGLHHCQPFARRMPLFIFVKCFSSTLVVHHSSCRPPCFGLALLAFANGPGQSVCQWRRFVLPLGGSLGFGGCSPAPCPAWSGLPLMWLRLMKMYGFCQCRHWPWLSARAAVVWVMCRFAV